MLSSYPKLLLEVFLRSNFGKRYFKLSSAVTATLIFALIPFFKMGIGKIPFLLTGRYGGYNDPMSGFWGSYGTWYLFLVAFLVFSVIRWREIERAPSVFDFSRYTKSAGDIRKFFWDLTIFGRKPTVRQIEIYCEPAIFLGLGLLLYLFGQNVGMLFMVCSIFYSVSYSALFQQGDDFILDIIDQMIMNEERESAFVQDRSSEHTRGVRFYMDKPTSAQFRKDLSKEFVVKGKGDIPWYDVDFEPVR